MVNMFGRLGVAITLILLLVMPQIAAQICDNGVLYIPVNHTVFNETHISWFQHNKTIICPGGCADNAVQCASPLNVSGEIYIVGAIGLIAVAIIFVFLGINMHEEYGGLQMLFFGGALIILISLLGMLAGITLFDQGQVVNVMSWSYMVVITVFIIAVLYWLLRLVSAVVDKISRH